MKKLISAFCFLVISFISFAQANTINIWYTPVQKPSYVWDEYYYYFAPKDLAEDAAILLKACTGLNFEVMSYDGKSKTGIFLLLDSSKNNLANEAAIVNSDGKTFLNITGKYATGVSYALYTYLEKAGFKFYLPGQKWTTIPTIKNVYQNKAINNETWKPYFKVRTCFLSAGMHWVKNLDPQSNNLKEWNTWYRRNRMGSEYIVLGGHIGEAFNSYHQKEIESDSMILAPMDDGKRRFDLSAKLNPTYDKGVNLFIDWVGKQFVSDNKIVPSYIPLKTYQSIDPGDGLNYCHSVECNKKFKSISDQVFTIANKAAVKFKNLYPNAGVNLYAYSERADTPSFKIENNIHVTIVASAFQDVGTPTALIKRWAKKTKHTSIYDYLNIGVWGKDHPCFNLDSYFNYLDFVKQQNIEGFEYEAGGSSMAAGLIQYFILKYLANPYTDVEKQFDIFCTDVFGNAAPPLKKMLQEWYFSNDKLGTTYEQVTFNEAELGRFFNYVQEAAATKGLTALQQERIFQLKAYVVYLAKYYELRADVGELYLNRNNPMYVRNKTEDLLRYTWMLYPTLIFHNIQLNDVLKYSCNDDAINKKWDWAYSDIYKDITANASAKVEEEFTNAFSKYSHQAQPVYTDIKGLMTKAYKLRTDTIRIKMIDAASFTNYRRALEMYCEAPTSISIFYKALPQKILESKTNNIGFISLIKDDYSVQSEAFISPNKLEGTVNFNIPKAGNYKVFFAQHHVVDYEYTIIPRNSLFYINNSIIPMNGLQVMDNADVKNKINKQLAFYTGNADSINYSMIYADYGNYLHVYNYKGEQKILTINNPPSNMSFKLNTDEKNTFMYFTNDVFRWPPQFKTTPPYYFYLKYPFNKNK